MEFEGSIRGVWVKFTHKEACKITKYDDANDIYLMFIDVVPKWVADKIPGMDLAKNLLKSRQTMKDLNDTSDYEGVKIFFNIWDWKITKVNRRGDPPHTRKSPCRS